MEPLVIFIIFIVFSIIRSMGGQQGRQPGRPGQPPLRREIPQRREQTFSLPGELTPSGREPQVRMKARMVPDPIQHSEPEPAAEVLAARMDGQGETQKFRLDSAAVISGVVFTEILGRPRSQKPWRSGRR